MPGWLPTTRHAGWRHGRATEWNPCAFVPIVRTRPCSVFGRPVHLSGLLPLITTRWFSSSLSDPASRRTPCPPKIRRWRLQVSLSVSRLSPSCLTSLYIPCHHLRPVRRYPHLWISARGLGPSGTSTHLTRQLSGTHYEPLRHPSAPSLSLAGVRLIIPDHALGLPVLRALSLCTCRRHYPGAAAGCIPRSRLCCVRQVQQIGHVERALADVQVNSSILLFDRK